MHKCFISEDIADEYEEIMQKLMKNDDLVTELKKFLEVWSFGGVSALHKVPVSSLNNYSAL